MLLMVFRCFECLIGRFWLVNRKTWRFCLFILEAKQLELLGFTKGFPTLEDLLGSHFRERPFHKNYWFRMQRPLDIFRISLKSHSYFVVSR